MPSWSNFYPRSPCGERHSAPVPCGPHADISIHALLAESDTSRLHKNICGWGFLSTLSLRRATYGRINDISRLIFLSTLSLRRATMSKRLIEFGKLNFYPRSPCGERHFCVYRFSLVFFISIHALLAESDACTTIITICIVSFLSTLSLRRATHIFDDTSGETRHFYPRSPCGERQPYEHHASSQQEFLSTLSLRRATYHTYTYLSILF